MASADSTRSESGALCLSDLLLSDLSAGWQVKNKKLTRAQRNKRERHKASLKAALETRGQKSKEAELTQVGTYMKQIISTEKEQVRFSMVSILP